MRFGTNRAHPVFFEFFVRARSPEKATSCGGGCVCALLTDTGGGLAKHMLPLTACVVRGAALRKMVRRVCACCLVLVVREPPDPHTVVPARPASVQYFPVHHSSGFCVQVFLGGALRTDS